MGRDIDLLVLLNQFTPSNLTIYFYKPCSTNKNDSIYTSRSFKHKLYIDIVTFLHCFSGCDTTLCFAVKGKKNRANIASKNILQIISCSCETGCGNRKCSCRKHGLKCSHICTNCGDSDICTNID